MFNLYPQYFIFILTIIAFVLYLKLRNFYLKEDSHYYIEKQITAHKQYIPIYFILERNNKVDTINTIVYIKQHYLIYKNNDNKNTIIDLNLIKELHLDLKLNTTLKNQIVFDIIIDIINDQKSYHFIVKNKDNFIDVIDYLKKLHISMIDHHNIEKSYHDFPIYSQRQAYYYQNYKNLLESEMIL